MHEFSPGDDQENREKPLRGKRAIVTNISEVFCAETAILLAKEGVQIAGIVGNSLRGQEKATKVAMDIEYSGNGTVDIFRANVTSTANGEILQGAVGEKIDIFILSTSGTNKNARSEENNAWIDGVVLSKMGKGGTVILIAKDRKEEQLLKSRIPKLQEKEVSFAVVRTSKEVAADQVGKKVLEIIRQNDLPQGHIEDLTTYHDRGQ